MIYTGLIYEDGKYWIMPDKKGFVICRDNGVCSDIVGYADIRLIISGSSKGRTSHFDCDNAGSIPAPETINKEKKNMRSNAPDLKVIFKLLTYFILCYLIVLMIEHSSQNWGKDFMKQCCGCEIKG